MLPVNSTASYVQCSLFACNRCTRAQKMLPHSRTFSFFLNLAVLLRRSVLKSVFILDLLASPGVLINLIPPLLSYWILCSWKARSSGSTPQPPRLNRTVIMMGSRSNLVLWMRSTPSKKSLLHDIIDIYSTYVRTERRPRTASAC